MAVPNFKSRPPAYKYAQDTLKKKKIKATIKDTGPQKKGTKPPKNALASYDAPLPASKPASKSKTIRVPKTTPTKSTTIKKTNNRISPTTVSSYKNKLTRVAEKAALEGVAKNVVNTSQGVQFVRKGIGVSINSSLKNPKVKVSKGSNKFVERNRARSIARKKGK
jgi:hypothetical protein